MYRCGVLGSNDRSSVAAIAPPLHKIAVNTQIDRHWRTAFSLGEIKKASDFSKF
jgi:hypothetical protein